mmetsp:Transcript_63705/g.189842  ORF Transcript_63705/g.189842 Transcript_63705/m.189842 type:complete len:449 (+) Transcript_63705:163-1509(+)
MALGPSRVASVASAMVLASLARLKRLLAVANSALHFSCRFFASPRVSTATSAALSRACLSLSKFAIFSPRLARCFLRSSSLYSMHCCENLWRSTIFLRSASCRPCLSDSCALSFSRNLTTASMALSRVRQSLPVQTPPLRGSSFSERISSSSALSSIHCAFSDSMPQAFCVVTFTASSASATHLSAFFTSAFLVSRASWATAARCSAAFSAAVAMAFSSGKLAILCSAIFSDFLRSSSTVLRTSPILSIIWVWYSWRSFEAVRRPWGSMADTMPRTSGGRAFALRMTSRMGAQRSATGSTEISRTLGDLVRIFLVLPPAGLVLPLRSRPWRGLPPRALMTRLFPFTMGRETPALTGNRTGALTLSLDVRGTYSLGLAASTSLSLLGREKPTSLASGRDMWNSRELEAEAGRGAAGSKDLAIRGAGWSIELEAGRERGSADLAAMRGAG